MALFTKQEMQVDSLSGNKRLTCSSCKLLKNKIKSPQLNPSGGFKRKVLIIGESTSASDDNKGSYFNGRSGKRLLEQLESIGLSKKDVSYFNAVRCLPLNKKGKTRPPTNHEIDCCRVKATKTIKELKPKLIILLGDIAVQSIIGDRWKKDLGSITKWRGFVIPDQDYKCWIAPVFDPVYVTNMDKPEINLIWKQDFEKIKTYIDAEIPKYLDPKIQYHFGKDLSFLNDIRKKIKLMSFDYEATSIKPHRKGQRLLVCSIFTDTEEAHVFKVPKNRKKAKPLITLLLDKNVKKTAHNMKYEHAWTQEILGVVIPNWHWDTQIAAHLLDNRANITSLKFQTYVFFGIADYSSEIAQYFESDDRKNANSFNRLLNFMKSSKTNLKKVLTYCAYDSIYQYRLMELQQSEFKQLQIPF